MKKIGWLLLIILIAGCATSPSAPINTTNPDANNPAGASASASGSSTSAAPAEGLALNVSSPLDGDVFTTPEITVSGTVSEADVVLTVNDDIVLVEDGKFNVPVTLEEGLNLIEIIASDAAGNEADLLLTVSYEP